MESQISFAQNAHAAKKSPPLRNQWAGIIALLALALLLILPGYAGAQTTTLRTSGTWSDANNWSNGVPTPDAYAYVDNNLTISATTCVLGTAGDLIVGESGTGTLSIQGGSITSANGTLGDQAGSNGTATITSGAWTGGQLSVGEGGTGTFNMNGGSVSYTHSVVGDQAGSNGTVTVTSGTWVNTNTLYIGNFGTGTLNIKGGTVTSQIGAVGTSSTVTVTGGNWTTNTLSVGQSGPGTLNVSGSGVVTIGNNGNGVLNLAPGSTLNMGTGGTAGTLNARAIFGDENATINFNHTGSYTFAAEIFSMFINKLGTGTTILTDTNSFADLTTVSQGELDVNGSLSSRVLVGSGATVGGSGATGAVTLNGGTIGGTLNTSSISGSGTIAPGNSPGILTTGTLTGGGGLSFKFELKQSTPNYGSATDSKNDLVHVTGSLNALTSADQITVYLSSAIPGTTYLGGLFVDNLSAALLGSAANNASFLYYILDSTGTSTTPGDIYYNGSYYTSLSAWYVAVSAVDLANTVFETGTVASGSELKFTVVPEPGTWALFLSATGLLALLQRFRRRLA